MTSMPQFLNTQRYFSEMQQGHQMLSYQNAQSIYGSLNRTVEAHSCNTQEIPDHIMEVALTGEPGEIKEMDGILTDLLELDKIHHKVVNASTTELGMWHVNVKANLLDSSKFEEPYEKPSNLYKLNESFESVYREPVESFHQCENVAISCNMQQPFREPKGNIDNMLASYIQLQLHQHHQQQQQQLRAILVNQQISQNLEHIQHELQPQVSKIQC